MSKTHLLDVNALVGLLWDVHSLHGRAHAWFTRESPVVLGCVFTELSFIRVSMADKTIAAEFNDAEQALTGFKQSLGKRYRYIASLPPASVLSGHGIRSHKEISDLYLCELAGKHSARLATLDSGIKHPAALFIG